MGTPSNATESVVHRVSSFTVRTWSTGNWVVLQCYCCIIPLRHKTCIHSVCMVYQYWANSNLDLTESAVHRVSSFTVRTWSTGNWVVLQCYCCIIPLRHKTCIHSVCMVYQCWANSNLDLTTFEFGFGLDFNVFDMVHSQKYWLIPLFIIISDNFLFIFSQVHWFSSESSQV